MKAVAGTLRLTLAQYRELQAFAQFGSDLDASTQRQLTRGARLVEILKQGQFSPCTVPAQVIQITAGNEGICDDVPVNSTVQFVNDLTAHFESNHSDLLAAIDDGTSYSPKKGGSELYKKVLAALKSYRSTWTA
jgi:F-type H+-transporting ATPase subunit alpha